MSVVPPGSGDKELLDDLFVSVLDATMDVEPHVHREHVDSFFVLKGTFTFNRSGEEVPLVHFACEQSLVVVCKSPLGAVLKCD